jgi:hypothetical protein
MGYAGGSGVICDFARKLKKSRHFTSKQRQVVYALVIEMLNEEDWDTQDEAFGEDRALDAALKAAGYGVDSDEGEDS